MGFKDWIFAIAEAIKAHKHDGSEATRVAYSDLSGVPLLTPTARNVAFDCLAGNDTVTYRAGIMLTVWDGATWQTRVLTANATVDDAADNTTKYPYAYYDSSTDSLAFEHSTTVPVWSPPDGFWVAGTDRTRRWLGVMMPKSSSSVMYAFAVTPIADGQIYMDYTPRVNLGIRLVNGLAAAGGAVYAMALTSIVSTVGNFLGVNTCQYAHSVTNDSELMFVQTNSTSGRRLSYCRSMAGSGAAIVTNQCVLWTPLTTVYHTSAMATTVFVDVYGTFHRV